MPTNARSLRKQTPDEITDTMAVNSGNSSADATIVGSITNDIKPVKVGNDDAALNDQPEPTLRTNGDASTTPKEVVPSLILNHLYSENVTAKIVRAAENLLEDNVCIAHFARS